MKRRYSLGLVDLPRCCNGYGAKFLIEHALACKKGGLIVDQHNEVKAETGRIAIQALGSNRVRNEPNIITCCDTWDVLMPTSTRTHPPLEQGVSEDGCAHAGDGVVVVGGFGWVGDADTGLFHGEGEESEDFGGRMEVRVVSPNSAGRKLVQMAVSINAKRSAISGTTCWRYCHSCW